MTARARCRTPSVLSAVILAVSASTVIAIPIGADAGSIPPRTVKVVTAPTALLARSDATLLRLRGDRPIPVMVRFDVDPIASYAGGIEGIPATSPSVTGVDLASNGEYSYQRYLASRMDSIADTIRRSIQGARVLRTYAVVYGGASMLVPAGHIRDLLWVPGVVAVQRDRRSNILATGTPHFLGADRVWPSVGGPRRAGRNVVIGVLDSGIWPEHPSLEDLGLGGFPRARGCEFGDGSNQKLGEPFICNRKLIGAYAFTDTYMEVIGAGAGDFCDNVSGECSARSADGHGTHTASTAAGAPTTATVFGMDRGSMSGVAPGARVIAYRVCLALGCYSSDSVSAIEQAVIDGVDVINFSISGGSEPYSDPVELAFLDAYAARDRSERLSGELRPRARHGGARWTVGDHGRGVIRAARLHDKPSTQRSRRSDVEPPWFDHHSRDRRERPWYPRPPSPATKMGLVAHP